MHTIHSNRVIGCSLSPCIHVAGICEFLEIAERCGYQITFLGPSVSINALVEEIGRQGPAIVGVGFRLSVKAGVALLEELERKASGFRAGGTRFLLGTLPEISEKAKSIGFFEAVFHGGEPENEVIKAINPNLTQSRTAVSIRSTPKLENRLIERRPLLRHHIGRPTVDETIAEIQKVSLAGVLDVVSLAPDQFAQEHYFRQNTTPKNSSAADGGVPIRSKTDLFRLFEATRRGNFPLMRCYSGTNDVVRFGRLLEETINNAWCAVPLCWYNELDSRSTRTLEEAMVDAHYLISHHAKSGIPVEVNESHQWSLRRAHDALAIAIAFISAYTAKSLGVKTYIAQYMLQTPSDLSVVGDLSKMAAKIELIESLHDQSFRSLRQIRSGISAMPLHENTAQAQLACSLGWGMSLKPDIVHVVACSEARSAANADEIISACQMATHIIKNFSRDIPDLLNSAEIQKRKSCLLEDANSILSALEVLGDEIGDSDPFCSPAVLCGAVRSGLLNAPQLGGAASGRVRTKTVNGSCVVVDENGGVVRERNRIDTWCRNLRAGAYDKPIGKVMNDIEKHRENCTNSGVLSSRERVCIAG